MKVLVVIKSIRVNVARALVKMPIDFDFIQPEEPSAEIRLTKPTI